MDTVRVGVFTDFGKRGPRFSAYTRYFHAEWKGCCVHEVQRSDDVRRAAIEEHKARCMFIDSTGNLALRKRAQEPTDAD